jgi:hypothetical protein
MRRSPSDPDAQRQLEIAFGKHDRLGKSLVNSGDDGIDVVRTLDTLQQHYEFVPTESSDVVTVAHTIAQPARHRAEYAIAEKMAVFVVDPLEVVQIHEQYGKLSVCGSFALK